MIDKMIDKEAIAAYVKKHYTYNPDSGRVRRIGRDRDVIGAHHYKGYNSVGITLNGKKILLYYHRAVWLLCYGRWPTQIDHIDGNKQNNRVENLREVTQSENDRNRVFPWKPNAVTGLPGVYRQKGSYITYVKNSRRFFSNKYQAFITTILMGRMYENK